MGLLALTYGFILAILGKDLMGYATVIGASVAFVSAGGAVKAAFEAKHDKQPGPPTLQEPN